jgi:hypothetical protein
MAQNVDHDIEQFWLGFKASMINFYNGRQIQRPIKEWCDKLNELQSLKDYDTIESSITKYISLFSIDLMRTDNYYAVGILNSNIKRWDKISNKYKIFDGRDKTNKGCNLITTLLSIYTLLKERDKMDKMIFDQLELFIFFGDFRDLIQYARDKELPSIVDKLLKFDPKLFSQVKDVFWLDDSMKYPISAMKIFRYLDIQEKN